MASRDSTSKSSGNKTAPTAVSVDSFLDTIADPAVRADCDALVAMMRALSGEEPTMWGPSMVGFGRYHYRYDSGREGDWLRVGFAPRKGKLTLYIMSGFDGEADLLAQLGPHTTGVSCLYIKRLADVDRPTLETLITHSLASIATRYP
jgi:hypothetical protein